MKNRSNSKWQVVIRDLCFSKEHVFVNWSMIVLLGFLNVILLPLLFQTDIYFKANDMYEIFIVLVLLGVFLLLCGMTYVCFHQKHELIDEAKPIMSAWLKSLSLCLHICVFVIVQTLIFAVCSLLSPHFDVPLAQVLLDGIETIGTVFVWSVICLCLYILSGNSSWYFWGLIAFNFSPSIIGMGCYEIYNINPMLPYKDCNSLKFNIFVMSGALCSHFIYMALALGILIILICTILFVEKSKRTIELSIPSSIYKLIVIFLLSVAPAVAISILFRGEEQVLLISAILFFIVALSVALVVTYLMFKRKKPFLHMCSLFVAVTVSAALMFGAIPLVGKKSTYHLPEKEEIQSVEIYLDSLERFEIDGYLEECIELHELLLEIFKEGHSSGKMSQEYKEPECIAELWNKVSFNYKLSNGKSLYRYYENLNDPAFDEFYIDFMKSELYISSLQKTNMDFPSMRYYYGEEDRYCELSESSVRELLNTYCDELRAADTSAFYEEYRSVKLNGVYEYYDGILYIPMSFTKTLSLVAGYIEEYYENDF